MNKSPCKGCEKRVVGCHGSCESYKAFDAERKEINQKRQQDKDLTNYTYGRVLDNCIAWKNARKFRRGSYED